LNGIGLLLIVLGVIVMNQRREEVVT